MPRFTSRPSEIVAIRWTGDNFDELRELVARPVAFFTRIGQRLRVVTLSGDAWAEPGDWVCKTDKPGDFYPCKPDIFERRWQEVKS